MADDETRPLLTHSTSPWSQQPTSSSPISSSASSNPNARGSYRGPLNERGISFEIKNRTSWQVRYALASILLAVILERFTFYGLVGNLVLFLNEVPYNWESYHAVSASFLFLGVSYVMSLIGGWISDSLLGRFKTIIMAYVIYLCGYVMLPFLSVGNGYKQLVYVPLPTVCLSLPVNTTDVRDKLFEEPCAWLIFITLVVIAAAAGIFKANICPFGADQLVQATQQTQLSFFNLFYWCVNIGSFLGLGVIAYVEQQESFQTGFIVCTVSLACSAIIFIAGRCCYISRPRDGSVLTNIFKILREAWQNKRQRRRLNCALKRTVPEWSHTDVNEQPPVKRKISFLDYAKHCHGGSFHNSLVDDVKKLGMILAVFAVLIPYWLVYFQMQTTFVLQALHMKLDLSYVNWTVSETIIVNNKTYPAFPIKPSTSGEFKFVAAWFSLFDAVVVIILLPLFDRVIYPRMARAGYPFTFGKRIVLGMLFAMAAMIAAGVVEFFRLKAFWPDDNCIPHEISQRIGDTIYYAADLSVFWQIPQYLLIGISEVFASVASLQFAVTVAPKSMKAVITGLFYFFSGIASFLGIAIVLSLARANTWFQSTDYGNINCKNECHLNGITPTGDCHLDYYFYSLAGWEALGLILFFIVAYVFQLNSEESVINSRRKNTGSQSRQIQRLASSTPSTPS